MFVRVVVEGCTVLVAGALHGGKDASGSYCDDSGGGGGDGEDDGVGVVEVVVAIVSVERRSGARKYAQKVQGREKMAAE